MEIQAFMVTICRDETKAEKFNDKNVESVIKLEELEPLDYEPQKNAWFTHTHYKSQDETTKNFKRFCFKVVDYLPYSKEELSFAFSNDKTGLPIVYDFDNDVWYQKAIVKKNQKEHKWVYDNSNSAIGICASGIFNVQAIVNNTVVYTSPNVIVLPSCITSNDYITMLNDLVRINRKLINKEKSISLGQNAKTTFEKEKVAVKELYKYLILINKSPETNLIKEVKALVRNKVKKYNTKTIINLSVSDSPKIKAEIDVETTNTYEHKVIYQFIIRLKNYLEMKYSQIMDDTQNLIKTYSSDFLKGELREKEYLIKLYEENQERNILKNKLMDFEQEIQVQYEQIVKTLEQIEKIELFSKITKENVFIQPTALFLFNPLYSKVWNIIKEIPEIKDDNYLTTFSLTQNINSVSVENTEQIYEYWCFIKMLDLLTGLGWQISDKGVENIKDCLREYIEQKTTSISIKGDSSDKKMGRFEIDLTKLIRTRYKTENEKITVIFDKPISEENKKRPDFTIRYDNKDVFLDAKYMSSQLAINQVYPVAVEKYLITRNEEKRKTVASFIIHPNTDAYYFGGKKINEEKRKELLDKGKPNIGEYCQHRYGHIGFIPSNTIIMRYFLRMVFEYHFDFKYNCWNCGSNQVEIEENSTRGGNEKNYCTCKNCKSFWVKTNCGNPKGPHTIIKRQYGCYHHSVDRNGFKVECPICGYGLKHYYGEDL